MPNKYLFHVEAVNLAPTVYDTSDISTIRGGGFYLLRKVHDLAVNLSPETSLITEGASTAVLKVETNDPAYYRRQLLECLYMKDEDCIPEMMFLVEYICYSDPTKFSQAMAALQGKIRLRQMQTANVRLFADSLKPGKSADGRYRGFDELNRVLPAHSTDPIKKEISSFTEKRCRYGRNLRKEIYKILLANPNQDLNNYDFTDNLEALSTESSEGNLDGKIAFIYIDGNKFGKLQQDFDEAQLSEYDRQLREVKSHFLGSILELAHAEPSFRNKGDIRLEVLLWGGDEIKLIVPAWWGWRVAALFFKTVATLNPHMMIGSAKKELTYAMGLVFAHHNNPIRNVTRIAEELAASVKTLVGAMGSHDACYHRSMGDRLHYVVLESLEMLPDTYESFVKTYYGRTSADICLDSLEMERLNTFAKRLKGCASRSFAHRAAAAWYAEDEEHYKTCIERGIQTSEVDESQKAELRSHIISYTGASLDGGTSGPDKGYHWLQLSELWDYLP